MDNEDDDDDDGNFTKWMSSYWGHGAVDHQARERKRSFVSPRSAAVGRRASLPCMSQLKHLHTATMDPCPAETEVPARPHPHRVSADQTSWRKGGSPGDADRPIPGLSGSLEMLHLRRHRVTTLSGENNVCLMCREKLCNGKVTGDGQDLRYSHRFHKEVKRAGEEGCPRSGRATAACEQRVEVDRKNITCHAINCSYGNNAD